VSATALKGGGNASGARSSREFVTPERTRHDVAPLQPPVTCWRHVYWPRQSRSCASQGGTGVGGLCARNKG
jgi:hypothetical protein